MCWNEFLGGIINIGLHGFNKISTGKGKKAVERPKILVGRCKKLRGMP